MTISTQHHQSSTHPAPFSCLPWKQLLRAIKCHTRRVCYRSGGLDSGSYIAYLFINKTDYPTNRFTSRYLSKAEYSRPLYLSSNLSLHEQTGYYIGTASWRPSYCIHTDQRLHPAMCHDSFILHAPENYGSATRVGSFYYHHKALLRVPSRHTFSVWARHKEETFLYCFFLDGR